MSKKKLEAVVLQQGGSTSEWYAEGYSSMKDAEQAVKGHEEASYQAVALEVPEALAKNLTEDAETALIDLLKNAASAATSIG